MNKALKSQVKNILINCPDARNSDITLTIEIWRKYYNVGDSVPVKYLYELPREDNIKRLRAKFCELGNSWAYPTDPKVARARQIKDDEWKRALGYAPTTKTIFFETGNGVIRVPENEAEGFTKLNPNAIRL